MKTRITLVVVSLILSVLIGIGVSKNNDSSKQNIVDRSGKILIGLSMDTLKEARWQKDRDFFVKRAEELGGKVLVQSANSDDTRQIKDVKSLLANNIDVLVVVPHDGAAMAEAVRLAEEAGVPVISYDRLITNCDLDIYLSFDNVRVGEEQAKYLVKKLPDSKGKIVRLYGAPTDNNAKLFKKGQDNILNPLIKSGDIEVIHEDWTTDWDPANAKKIMNAAITKYGNAFDAVLASNDGTAGGAIQALKEAKLAGKVIVTGQDADRVACQRIVRGSQTMTIYKPIKKLANRAAELAIAMAKGKPVVANGIVSNGQKDVPSVLLAVTAVDKDNMRETIIADGFHTEEDIFSNSKGN